MSVDRSGTATGSPRRARGRGRGRCDFGGEARRAATSWPTRGKLRSGAGRRHYERRGLQYVAKGEEEDRGTGGVRGYHGGRREKIRGPYICGPWTKSWPTGGRRILLKSIHDSSLGGGTGIATYLDRGVQGEVQK